MLRSGFNNLPPKQLPHGSHRQYSQHSLLYEESFTPTLAAEENYAKEILISKPPTMT